MKICPKCKNEYRKGITICTDCNVPLVDELIKEEEKKAVFTTPEEALANRFIEFLNYSNITSGTVSFVEKEEVYTVLVEESDFKQAKKLFKGFFIAETEDAIQNELEKIEATKEIPNITSNEEVEEILSDEELKQEEEQKKNIKTQQTPAKVYVKKERR